MNLAQRTQSHPDGNPRGRHGGNLGLALEGEARSYDYQYFIASREGDTLSAWRVALAGSIL